MDSEMTASPAQDLIKPIGLQNMKRHVAAFEPQMRVRISAVIDASHFILGNEVHEFESTFANYIGVSTCLTVGNGTQAMELALRAMDIGAGDEVMVTANAGFYSTCAVLAVGATPVFLDIRAETMNLEPAGIAAQVTARTKAVIATHLYGQACDIVAIERVCRRLGLYLVEDCAEAHGACVNGKRVGSFGAAGCFSFYPTKNLGAYGDAGAITTNDPILAERIQQMRQYGWCRKYHVGERFGMNTRMDEIQAAVLNVKFPHMERMNERRRAIAAYYNDRLRGIIDPLPFTCNDDFIVHHYVLRTPDRGWVMNELKEMGVLTDIHFPIPDHRQQVFGERFRQVHLPVTEQACDQVFTVPSFAEMTDGEVEFVGTSLRQVLSRA